MFLDSYNLLSSKNYSPKILHIFDMEMMRADRNQIKVVYKVEYYEKLINFKKCYVYDKCCGLERYSNSLEI